MRIAVIGAGPSGSRAGAGLATLGHEVVLIDRSFDREKPCGGGVPAAGLRALGALPRRAPDTGPSRDPEGPDVDTHDEVNGVSGDASGGKGGPARRDGFGARRLALIAPSGARAVMELPDPVTIFSRRRLDRALLGAAQAAGARLVPGAVTEIVRAGEGGPWRVRLAGGSVILADHLVGADGARSVVRRELDAPFGAGDLSQAVGWYVPGRATDDLAICFDARIDGYLWIFPRPDHLAVGACAPLREGAADALWETGRDLLRESLGIEDTGLARYSALIPTLGDGSLSAHRVQGEGWSLVGDAAATVDPITREGIRHGIESSDLLVAAFARRDPALYEALWRARFEADFRWAASHRAGFFAPRTTERFVRYVARSRAVRAVLADLVLGDQDYLSLKRRLVRTALPLGADLLMSRARSFFGAPARGVPR